MLVILVKSAEVNRRTRDAVARKRNGEIKPLEQSASVYPFLGGIRIAGGGLITVWHFA